MKITDGRNPNAIPTTLMQDQFDALLPQRIKIYSPEWKSRARVCIYKIGGSFITALQHDEILTLCAGYKTERGAQGWVVRNYPHATITD